MMPRNMGSGVMKSADLRNKEQEENMAKILTADNFDEEVRTASGPVLVDFWAQWCGPCRMQAPAVEKLAEEGYQAGKVNVDEQPALAAEYQVMNIPTLIIFKDGREVDRMVGVQSGTELARRLDLYK